MSETEPWREDRGPRDDLTVGGWLSRAISPGTDRRTFSATEASNGLYVGRPDHPDDYELVGQGLRGGEGVTWRARYRGNLTQAVEQYAVKAVLSRGGRDWPTRADLNRWWDDVHLLRALQHPHLLRVHDMFTSYSPHPAGAASGPDDAVPYVLMEWVPGESLQQLVTAGHLDFDQRLRHVAELADALTALHSVTRTMGNPMVHRDVKPDNAVVDPRRGLVLVDIGGLRRLDDGRDPRGMHTVSYTAPEVLADPVAPRAPSSDLFALGATAYFALVGEVPAPVTDPNAVRHMHTRLVGVAGANGVSNPAEFASEVLQMLEANPYARPSNAPAWAKRLRDNFAAGQSATRVIPPAPPVASVGAPRPPRRKGPIAVAAVVAAAVLIGGGAYAGATLLGGSGGEANAGPTGSAPTTTSASPTPSTASPTSTTSSSSSTTSSATSIPTTSTGGASTPAPTSSSTDMVAVPGSRAVPNLLLGELGLDFDAEPPTGTGTGTLEARSQYGNTFFYAGEGQFHAAWNEDAEPTLEECRYQIATASTTADYDTSGLEVGNSWCLTTDKGATVFMKVTAVEGTVIYASARIWDAA